MNYAALSNTSPVIHMHLTPRYKESRAFDNVTFKDTRWGQNYASYDRTFVIDESTLFKIREALKGHYKPFFRRQILNRFSLFQFAKSLFNSTIPARKTLENLKF